ncbi:hypothetical protein [Bacillus shivajii]|nr:hypothetical protein [Bacillus shivajii]
MAKQRKQSPERQQNMTGNQAKQAKRGYGDKKTEGPNRPST